MAGKLASVGNALYIMYDRTVTALLYFTFFIVMTGITVAVISITLGSTMPKGGWALGIVFAVSAVPGLAFLFWRIRLLRWRTANPQLYADEMAADAAARVAALERAKSLPPHPFWSSVESLTTGLFYVALSIGGIYIAYLIVSSLPVSVAIVLGALIITEPI